MVRFAATYALLVATRSVHDASPVFLAIDIVSSVHEVAPIQRELRPTK